MKHPFWKPALLTVAILVVVTASGILLRGNTGSGPEQVQQTPKGAAAAGTGSVDESAKSAGAHTAGENPGGGHDRRRLLETVGVLTAAHCYQTYLGLGLLADAKDKGVYSGKEAYKLLDSVLGLVDSVAQKLAGLNRIDLDKEDQDSLEQMRVLSGLLRQQAKALAGFWDSGKEEDAARYESVRKDAWAAISRLTGAGRQ
jgi:hypothetical protein